MYRGTPNILRICLFERRGRPVNSDISITNAMANIDVQENVSKSITIIINELQ